MADLTPDQRIDHDRREKWVAFRRKRNMPDDAPFVGKCPWEECYEEQLDTLNYVKQIEPKSREEANDVAIVETVAREIAAICLRRMKGAPE
jgi:hypothetical protein